MDKAKRFTDTQAIGVLKCPRAEATMFKVLILICAVTIDRSACTPENAVDIVRGPPAHSMSQCIHESQTTLARTTLAPDPGKQYMKVVCASDQTS